MTVIQNLPPPINKTGVKSFLGVVNFYQSFIRDCSTLAKPLIFLTRGRNKNGPIVWGEDQELSFNTLKNKLLSSEVLQFPDFSKPFTIETWMLLWLV